MSDMSGDAFVLLVNVFNDQSIDKMSDTFVQKLIKSLEYITDDNTVNALISILVILCAAYEKKIQKELTSSSQTTVVNLAY